MHNPLSGFTKPPVPATPELIGVPSVTFDNIEESIEAFYQVYQKMPVIDNAYGMRSCHLFLAWHSLRQLKPSFIIESGVYKGLGTWWLEQACPEAKIFCIDIDYSNIEYKSPSAVYLHEDFTKHTWDDIDKNDTVIFFDDHQNALQRLMQMKWMGFRKAIFEDNYAPYCGDCYSCKKMLAQTGNQWGWDSIEPNPFDRHFFIQNLKTYQQFPAVFRLAKNRFGFPWTEDALLEKPRTPAQELLLQEASAYTYMCYVELAQQ